MKLTDTWIVLGVLGLSAGAGCSSSNNNNNTPADASNGKDAGVDGGITPNAGMFCPETNPISPVNANSVVVSDPVIPADTTWTADKVYLIGDDYRVEGHTLTVEAGTTICLYQTGRIIVGEGIDPGEIHLDGTAAKPIVITTPASSSDSTKPDTFHRGIQMDTYEGSTISYVNIWYGGPGGGSGAFALELQDTAHGTPNATAPLLIDHLTVGDVQSEGIRIGTPLGVADGSTITFTGFAPQDADSPALNAVAEIDIGASASFAKAFSFSGSIPAAAKHVNLVNIAADGMVSANTDLVDFGLPYVYRNQLVLQIAGMQDDPIGATLTIHAGVTLQMDGALVIGGTSGTAEGNLIIAGTAAKPVILTSTQATPASGDWEGLYFVGGQYDPTKSSISNAQISYAGVSTADPSQVNYHIGRCGDFIVGAIMIDDGGGGQYAGPSISNTVISHSLSDGIASFASTNGGYCTTNYGTPDITFVDIAGETVADNGTCN